MFALVFGWGDQLSRDATRMLLNSMQIAQCFLFKAPAASGVFHRTVTDSNVTLILLSFTRQCKCNVCCATVIFVSGKL